MKEADLYAASNSMQKRDTSQVLSEFSGRLRYAENENVLDIGCGPGDVTAEMILPLLPKDATLVGIDINEEMVNYARQHYVNPRLTFKALDFQTDNILDYLPAASFSKIFSFYCLHWLKNQKQVMKNLSTLLCDGGESLMVLMESTHCFLLYETLSQMSEWKTYMKDVDNYISPYHNVPDPKKKMTEIANEAGLEILTCESRPQVFTFPNETILTKSIIAVNPFIERIPEDLKSSYIQDINHIIKKLNLTETSAETGEATTEYRILVVHCQKNK